MNLKPLTLTSIACVMILVTACSTLPYVDLNEEVPQFIGKDISYAIKYLGYPDRKDSFDGRTVYIWEDAGVGSTLTSVRVPSQSTSYTGYGVVTTTSYQDTFVSQPYSYSCKIRLFTDSRKKVVDTDLDNDGCSKYSDRMATVKQAEIDRAKAAEEAAKKKVAK